MTIVKGAKMEKIPISEFKAKCLGILEEVYRKKKRIIITKRGQPIVEVRAIDMAEEKVPLKDTLVFMEDIISPVAEEDWEVLK